MSNKQIPEEVLQKALDYADIIDKTDLNINMVAYDAWLTGYKAALHPPQRGSAEDRKKRVAEIYEENRPSFRDWGTLKDMCIATAIQYADEYAATQPSGKAGAVSDAVSLSLQLTQLREENERLQTELNNLKK